MKIVETELVEVKVTDVEGRPLRPAEREFPWVELQRSGVYTMDVAQRTEHYDRWHITPKALLRIAESINQQVPTPVYRDLDDVLSVKDHSIAGWVRRARVRHDGARTCVDVLVDPSVLDNPGEISYAYTGPDCDHCGLMASGLLREAHHVQGIFLTMHPIAEVVCDACLEGTSGPHDESGCLSVTSGGQTSNV